MDSLTNDIRIIKYEDYIKKKPDKAYGYYALGELYLRTNRYLSAISYLKTALSKKPDYAFAIVSLIDAYFSAHNYYKAVCLYLDNRTVIDKKNIFKVDLNRRLSNLFLKKVFPPKNPGIIEGWSYKASIKKLTVLFNKNQDTQITHLILSMHYLNSGVRNDHSLVLYNLSAGLPGLNDNLRWDLVRNISKDNSNILKDKKVASYFDSIPDEGCSDEYANILLSAFLDTKNDSKISKAISYMISKNIVISKNNLFRYINYCFANNIFNTTVYRCCVKLLKSGWVDNIIAQMVLRLRDYKVIKDISEVTPILNMYGYL